MNFIINALTCFSSIKGKINFLQMERFSDQCEQYFRINFENKFKAYKIGYMVSGYGGKTVYIENNYSSSSSSVQINGENVNSTIENKTTGFNGEPVELENFKNQDFLSNTLGFDFDNVWAIEDDNFPVFKSAGSITKIDKTLIPSLSVYPNPANQYLYINSDSSIKKIDMYDSVGSLVLTETNLNGKIDVSTLNTGLYIVKVYTENKVVSQKVIVNH